MLLYPTETIYALGVNALNEAAVQLLYKTKGRVPENPVSLLVRNEADIAKYAHVNDTAHQIISKLLPGPLTIVLPAKENVPDYLQKDGFISFRISSDRTAQQVIAAHMRDYQAPLTCTSANHSGQPPQSTPAEICTQLGELASNVKTVHDDGPRSGTPSTVLLITDSDWQIIREGAIDKNVISHSIATHLWINHTNNRPIHRYDFFGMYCGHINDGLFRRWLV